MIELNKLIRDNIKALKAYASARDEYSGNEGIFLDANENPFGDLNRYPDPYQTKLKTVLGKAKNIASNSIFIGNGSDEVIDLLYRVFCNPGKDKALTFAPTYGMYDVSASINDVELVKLEMNENFALNFNKLVPFLDDDLLKLILICSPNNPTGNSFDFTLIERIIANFNGIVLVDEAYIDFSNARSTTELIGKYSNLIVSQTFSKARGLAAARVGIAYSNPEMIALLNKVKPPYNVSLLNQQAAISAFENETQFEVNKQLILAEKETLKNQLNALEIVIRIYPSDANFFLVEVKDANRVYQNLVDQKIIVRNRNQVVRNCIRITVGSASENQQLINALKTIKL
ncbi:MAG: histidinol-phosphate transaminase [Crocinitomicaceae bacterium]